MGVVVESNDDDDVSEESREKRRILLQSLNKLIGCNTRYYLNSSKNNLLDLMLTFRQRLLPSSEWSY